MGDLMANGGWVKLHRQLLANPVFKNDKLFRVFIYLLLSAQHTEGDLLIGDAVVHLEVGQWATGRHAIARDTGLTEQNVRTALSKLEKLGMLTIKPTTKYSIISITNWSKYQQDNQQVTNSQPTSNQQVTTNKNAKKEKNEQEGKELISDSGKPPQKEEVNFEPFELIGFDEQQIADIKKIRKDNKGGKITQRVVTALAKEFDSAMQLGMTREAILDEWASRGWKSFKTEWTDLAKGKINGRQGQDLPYSATTARNIESIKDWG